MGRKRRKNKNPKNLKKYLEEPRDRMIRPADPLLFVALTTYRTVEQRTVQSLFNAMGMLPYNFNLATHSSANVWRGRNILADHFLSTPADYLIFIDADMVFTPQDMDTLVRAAIDTPDAGIIGGFYVSRDTKMRPLISWTDDDGVQLPLEACVSKLRESRGQLVEADLIPTGFMLIKREVVEAIEPPRFIVESRVAPDGTRHDFSSDNVFVRKAQEAGFKTYGHFGIELGHVGNYVYHPAQMWPQLDAYAGMQDLFAHKVVLGEKHGYDSQEYWDGLYRFEHEIGRERVYPGLHQALLSGIQEGWRVADVGSGPGVLASEIAKIPGTDVHCYDLSQTAVELCQDKGLTAFQWDLVENDPPSVGDYDCVVCTEVLEHLADPQAAVDRILTLLKPDGMFLFSVPENRLPPEEEPEHKQVFTAAKFAALFKGNKELFVEPIDGYLIAAGKKPA
jgi:2-polyprenyl-3-methyl-5-hydroxy-6-metoxy-1,4-benzoquinol methylase